MLCPPPPPPPPRLPRFRILDPGYTWAIYNHGTPFFERYADFEKAIKAKA